MKKLKINTKKTLILTMGIIAIIGLLWSCEKDKADIFWNDNEAAVLSSISPEGSFVDAEVTICGKYFSSKADNTVTFGGMDATITGANLTEITVEIPGITPGSAVDVVVTSDGLTSNTLSYTAGIPVIPVLSSLDPTEGKVGSSVVITGTDFGATTTDNVVKFGGAEAVVTDVTATTVTATIPAGAPTGIVDVTVTVDGESNVLTFTILEAYTLVVQIPPDSFDDAEEGALNGAMALESSDLELGEYDTWTQTDPNTGLEVDQGVQTIGMRFNGISIPQGATILSASIQFTCDATGADPAQMTIYGENIADAPVFTEDLYNISSRTQTTGSAVWEIPEWVAEGDVGTAQRTPELATIVQELVDRGDWASDNSMVFIMVPSGGSENETSSSGGREAEASDGSSSGTLAPVLTIVYDY